MRQKRRQAVSAERLLRSVRQRRHRAALLRAASGWLRAEFTTALGGEQPRLLIRERDGRVEPADVDVVIDVVGELERGAQEQQQALVALLALDLQKIGEKQTPIIEGTELPDAAEPQPTEDHGDEGYPSLPRI